MFGLQKSKGNLGHGDRRKTYLSNKLIIVNFFDYFANLVNYNQQIEDLQRQLEQLREEKKALENHAQQLGSAENAAESALEQVRTALMMVRATCGAVAFGTAPGEVETFKAAIGELFAGKEELPVIEPEGEEKDTEVEVTVDKVADGGAAVTIEVEVEKSEVRSGARGWEDFNKLQSTVGSKTSNQKSPPYPPLARFPHYQNAHQESQKSEEETLNSEDLRYFTAAELKIVAKWFNLKSSQGKSKLAEAIAAQGVTKPEVERIISESKK